MVEIPTDLDVRQDLAEDLAEYEMDGAGLTTTTCKAAIRRALYAELLLERLVECEKGLSQCEAGEPEMSKLAAEAKAYLARRVA